MKSMASTQNTAFCRPEAFVRAEKRNFAGFCGLGNHGKVRERLVVKANVGGYKGVDMINGRKVNGVVFPNVDLSTRGIDLVKKSSSAVVNVPDPVQSWLLGRFVEDRFVYRQTFVIRSYEIGPDKTATMETLMNLLQVCSLSLSSSICHAVFSPANFLYAV